MRSATLVVVVAWVSLAGCSLGRDGSTVGQSWQLDRLRLLAARAEPAEAAPGEDVGFEALVFVPPGDDLTLLFWTACVSEGVGQSDCVLDPDMESELRQLDPDLLDSDEEQDLLERAAELGIFAIEPISEPRWTVPVDALDDGGEAGPPMGVQATIQQVAISELELEVAVRSLAISTEPSPNDNPGLLGLTVDGKALDDGASLMLEAGESYELLPRLLEGSLESYTVLDAEGLPIESVEEPYLSWYAQEGSFGATVTTAEDEPTTWTAPDDAHEGVLICVVRDGRGGMDWTTLQVEVE